MFYLFILLPLQDLFPMIIFPFPECHIQSALHICGSLTLEFQSSFGWIYRCGTYGYQWIWVSQMSGLSTGDDCNWNYACTAFSDWLLSLSNMHLSFLHVFRWFDSSYFKFLNNIPLCGYISLFSHLLKDLVSSLLKIMNKAAINICV